MTEKILSPYSRCDTSGTTRAYDYAPEKKLFFEWLKFLIRWHIGRHVMLDIQLIFHTSFEYNMQLYSI